MVVDRDLLVIGLGYVGLPLAQEAVRAGLRVSGLDTDVGKVEALNKGVSYVDDLSDEDVRTMRSHGFVAHSDPAVIGTAKTVVICVPTPLNESGAPDLSAVISVSGTISEHLSPGSLVVLESTTYPGTTEDVVRPILESRGLRAGRDFYLAYSPERIDPGNNVYGVANTPKVVGGIDERSTAEAVSFYSRFVGTVVTTRGTREAEMAKLLENTYRHVNIALVNEMAVFCNDLGIDLWDAIGAASTKPFGFHAFYPGPGVGGHCIPIDPNYLSYKVRTLGYPFRFVELAQEISARMPAYVVSRVMLALNRRGRAINGSRVLLAGVAYKPNISDERETPALPVAARLLELGAELEYADPHVPTWRVAGRALRRRDDVEVAAKEADAVILLQDHAAFDLAAIASAAQLVFDTRGRLYGDNVERL